MRSGDTVISEVVAPVLHKYVPPPPAVIVVDPPLHIVISLMAGIGAAATVTATVS